MLNASEPTRADRTNHRIHRSRSCSIGQGCQLVSSLSWTGVASGSLGRLSGVPAETHVNNDPIGRDEILEIVRDRLADILEIDPATISEGQSFVDDLEADSLALIELVESLEEELSDRTVGFRIEDEDLEDLKTVRDAVDYVHERVGG